MKKFGLIITLLLLSVTVFSQEKGLRVEVKDKKKVLKDFVTVTGMESCGKDFFMVNDDTPWLYKLNNKLKPKSKFLIYPAGEKFNILPESLKPDFQSVACRNDIGELMIFGSGKISPQSDIIVKYNIKTATAEIFNVKEFYDVLSAAANLKRNALNIKGAVIAGGILYLFDGGTNKMFVYKLHELDKYLNDYKECPVPEVYNIMLPRVDGKQIRFSGADAAFDNNRIIFTATIDSPDNSKSGSYLGYINLLNFKDNFKPVCVQLEGKGNKMNIKAESVIVKKEMSGNMAELLIVSDANEKAELLTVDMSILIR